MEKHEGGKNTLMGNDDDGNDNEKTIPTAPNLGLLPTRSPSPLQRDVGEFLHALRRVMRGRIPGGTQEVGGPASASRKRT